ncbi:alpha/beta fold hydrolase [Nocardioides bizhenqiangii]|uniref:Alpha/beta fold hydrolase n=1 Tax=Nocardioides bizhenqiangii TaxID=3095076 RepID=A0ABZ0ZU73_9ACTN|nr:MULTISPECIES: alpha/beta fold hydrolase [unclassified Nocardioides]MDZ5622132.1 alpha/beta fold hydrolase [Nocardioides sp. HM23]WQQ27197.1 alpha/beta fold hydrolase [Nocardioides sp. HM61]
MTEERIRAVERDGLAFDVIDAGPVDGEPVVLLHGWPERATSWRHVTPILNAAGYRTLAMDRRGFAPRARPRRRRDYRLSLLVDDVVALIDEAGGSAHVVGHDWGAAVAWAVAGLHPDKVRTLTAVSVGHPAAFFKAMVKSDQLRKSWYMAALALPVLPELTIRRWSDWFDLQLLKGGMSREDVARFRREIVDDGALPTSFGCYRGMLLTDPRIVRFRVSAPTTMVWSTGDVALGRWGAAHSAEWVDGPFRLVVLDGVSHWVPTEVPDVLAGAILERVAG